MEVYVRMPINNQTGVILLQDNTSNKLVGVFNDPYIAYRCAEFLAKELNCDWDVETP